MRVAVIGTGVAGLGCAYLLRDRHELTLFEASDRIGGHVNTISVPGAGGELGIDTGFIVHNTENYPNLVRLFTELGVATQKSEMTFAVRREADDLEYSGRLPWHQPHTLRRPRLLKLLAGIARLLRTAHRDLAELDGSETLADWARRRGHGGDVLDLYLVPMSAALWSADPDDAANIPARFILQFFDHHALLGFRRHQWRTVTGGSRRYVEEIVGHLAGHEILTAHPVSEVRRHDGKALVTAKGVEREFDAVVIATHPDQALAMLADPSERERRLLGAFLYTASEAILHTDASVLPRRRGVQASWNYLLPDAPDQGPRVTYLMNRLQQLREPQPYCVSLNCAERIAPERIIARVPYEHPRFSVAAVAAQSELPGLGHDQNTAFCGAWQGWGFHEDGLTSGIAAARWLGAQW